MRNTNSRVYESLDLWRGFAALWVVLFHSFSSIQHDAGRSLAVNPLALLVSWGDTGVALFFVISGYCIAAAAANTLDRAQSVKKFIAARLLRIFPTYWVSLLLCLALMTAAWLAQNRGIISGSHMGDTFTTLTPWTILTNFLLLEVPFRQTNINIIAWTLNYELAFYAVVALGIVACSGRGWQAMAKGLHAVTVVALAASVFAPRWLFFPFDRWLCFGEGVLLFDLLCGTPWAERSGRARAYYGAVLVSIVALCAGEVLRGAVQRAEWQSLAATAFAVLLFVLRPFDARIRAAPPIRGLFFVGGMSYSLYLVHFPIIGMLRQMAKKLRFPVGLYGLEILIESALVVAFAYGFYRLVEARFLSLRAKTAPSVVAMEAVVPNAKIAALQGVE